MLKTAFYPVALGLLLALPVAASAQDQKPESPYNAQLVVRQPEIGQGNPSFVPSPKVRGMKALADGKVYWVSTDNRQLLAYQGNRLAWKTDVVGACPTVVGPRAIQNVVLSSNTIFVRVGERTFTEVNPDTGKVTSVTLQKN
ncbi:hypothetical protein [Hymenobacter properus]|uniref:Pyrrolo-quinoline quinone n=1 Tax=Hymenobacter properus TaxID=2791026 RepID=A0A931BIX6_9BACT|nr:hypothetical protein [Hymenobacter properus]MBF9143346.1 hypothetical protein [Hymenobacter properus]MBR7722156.1 hypothetical protein [Microvirga sp. SRT04]